MLLPLLFTTSLLLFTTAEPSLSPYQLHEKRAHVPTGWSLARRHDATSFLPLRFGLTQSNLHKIDQFLNDVAHPSSPNYSKHWSPKQIAETFAPSAESIDAVRSWLLDNGFESKRVRLAPTKAWIEVNTTVEEAERLLRTEYHVYEHQTGKKHVACEAYHLPAHISPHVDIVTPTVEFNPLLTKRSPVNKPTMPGSGQGPKALGTISNVLMGLQDCDKHITPDCLRALYGIIYEPLSPSQNSYGIVEFTPQAFLQSDLDLFNQLVSPELVGVSPTLVSIDGGVAQTTTQSLDVNSESNLDLQYAMTLVTAKQNVTLYQVGDLVIGGSFNNFLDALDGSYCTFDGGDDPNFDAIYPDTNPGGFSGPESCGIATPANVISISYGSNEAEFTPTYLARQCAEYAKLGLLGVTVLFSSGDNGVAGNGGLCLNPDGTESVDGTIFNPTFPATCPYVTSVGATQVSPGQTVQDPESACEQVIFSSGGFSNVFALPDYQKDAVNHFLQFHTPSYPPDLFNSTGISRGFPDLSANGANYVVAVDGSFTLLFGTSAAAPVVGAMITMINDLRITVGKKPVGFINPTIYSDLFQGAFNDIQIGGNRGCGTPGFQSEEGWDPVTGLGTPRFPELLTRWLALP